MTSEEQRTVDHAARALLMAAAEQKGAQRVLDTAYELLGLPSCSTTGSFIPSPGQGRRASARKRCGARTAAIV